MKPHLFGIHSRLTLLAAAWLFLEAAAGLANAAGTKLLWTDDGFEIPVPGRHFTFPRDHGSHLTFRLEWWYVTGHLHSESGQRYGFQATFFRRAGSSNLSHPAESTVSPPSSPSFGYQQLYLAHMALLDVQSGRFRYQERLNREGWDASASLSTLDVTNGGWSLRMTDPGANRLELLGSIRAEAAFRLELEAAKPMVMFGVEGVSRKALDPSAASHYLTFPRLRCRGLLTLEGRAIPVSGQAWMDHEISSSQLAEDQVGWDWACLQLDEGREIMVYRMRRQDGSADPFSTLAWIDRDGRVSHIGHDQFEWTPHRTWKSPVTGAKYPIQIQLRTRDPASGQEVVFILDPLAEAQELAGAFGHVAYWEGACRVLDARGNAVGSAFLELTGYAGKLLLR